MKQVKRSILCMVAGLGLALSANAQNVGIKTNLVSDALLSPNLGLQVGVAPKWTLNASAQFNLWSVKGEKWRHWLVQPEARYWFCRKFQGHFIGLHAIGGQYNVGNIDWAFDFLGQHFSNLKDKRYEGWGAGAGIGYGYAWPVAKHWNIEAEIGIGWIYTRYDAYPCTVCGTKLDTNHLNYFGPTKLAVNIEYLF
ncbi:MAG: DUF3575 domain-containing protein [Muribaculaceae bacterium]|nr:DUF3575 domain-containing protein [Muribaculaceae bacterium]